MRLNEAGRIIAEEWLRTSNLRPGVTVDASEFVVMPNHVHGILWLFAARDTSSGKGDQQVAPTQNNPGNAPTNPGAMPNPLDMINPPNNPGRGDLLVALPGNGPTNPEAMTNPPDMINPQDAPNPRDTSGGKGDQQVAPAQNKGPRPRSIGAIMAGFKAAAAKRINVRRGTPGVSVWQRNYHEHVIRNDAELAHIRQYIHDNPQRWSLDRENPEVHADVSNELWAGVS